MLQISSFLQPNSPSLFHFQAIVMYARLLDLKTVFTSLQNKVKLYVLRPFRLQGSNEISDMFQRIIQRPQPTFPRFSPPHAYINHTQTKIR